MLDDENGMQEYTKAIGYIYELINGGTLEVGSKLPTERAIAQSLGIGRNSTREALSILHGMGIIDRRQGSGNYISGNAGKSIGQIMLMMLALKRISRRDICEFRRSMEKTVCRSVIKNRINAEHEAALKACLDDIACAEAELAKSIEKDRTACLDRLAAADDAFHNELVNAADNALMAVVMDAVTQVYKEFIEHVIYNADESVRIGLTECHRHIYEGVVSADYELAEKAIDRHYDLVNGDRICTLNS